MNIWTISFIIGDLCIGFYTLFLIIHTISEIKAYTGDVYGANTELDKKITLDKIIFLLIMVAISFCPIFVYSDRWENSARRFRADLPPFQSNLSALLNTPFRKSSAYLSGDGCNDRFNIPPESLFRAL